MSNHKNKTALNDVTGDTIVSGLKGSSSKYAEGWDAIFKKKEESKKHSCRKCPIEGPCDYDLELWAVIK